MDSSDESKTGFIKESEIMGKAIRQFYTMASILCTW